MSKLNLIDEHARMGKISNNLEFCGEDDRITGFTLPIEMRITRGQLQDLMGDEFDAAVWKPSPVSGGGSFIAADWVTRVLPLALAEEVYIEVAAALALGGRELEFTDCRLSKMVFLAFGLGGITVVKCSLYVRPGIGQENLLLQEYQEQEVGVTLTQGKLRVKADKAQQSLALEEPKTDRESSFERGEPVDIITHVVDDTVSHEHPSFPAGRMVHAKGLPCIVCDGEEEAHDHPALNITGCRCEKLDDGLGTPPVERERALARERMIAAQIVDERTGEEEAA